MWQSYFIENIHQISLRVSMMAGGKKLKYNRDYLHTIDDTFMITLITIMALLQKHLAAKNRKKGSS